MDATRKALNELMSNRKDCIGDLLDNPFYPVFMANPDGVIIYWNKGAERILGYRKKDILGEKARILYPTSQKSDFDEDAAILKEEQILRGQRLARHKNGKLIWIEIYTKMLTDENGEPAVSVGTLFDRQSMKQMEEKLHENMARTEAIIKTTVDGIITIDTEGRILSFNNAAEQIFGYSENEIIGESVNTLIPAPHNKKHDQYIKRYLETGQKHVIDRRVEVMGVHKNGSHVPVELSVSEVNYYNKRIFTGILRDITERRKLEKKIVEISDEERMRIGTDLHDGLGQMLTGGALISQNIANRMKKESLPYAEDVEDISGLLKEADEYARDISHLMVPVELNEGKIEYALKTLCQRVEKMFEIDCRLVTTGPLNNIPKSVAIHMFHIAQEAINNAVKHGRASEVKLYFDLNEKELNVCIQDNGIGFPENIQLNELDGMGIRFMQHRVRILGGKLSVNRSSDGYTRVECRIPLMTMQAEKIYKNDVFSGKK